MRNLIILLWKNQFFILFLGFETASAILLFRGNNFQQSVFVNSANQVTAYTLSVVDGVMGYIGLAEENRKLALENALLRNSVPGAFYNDRLELTVPRDSSLNQRYTVSSFKVIGNSTGMRNNFMTLEGGLDHGIRPGMGVIGPNGIVGIVRFVTKHFSAVISVLHKDFKSSAKLNGSNYFGNLEWEGGDPETARLSSLPKHVMVKKGDTLVTTGFSTVFPEGILVGTVLDFTLVEQGNFYEAKIKLSTDFSNLSFVYVVNDLRRDEWSELERLKGND